MESPFTDVINDLRVMEAYEDELEREERERELRRFAEQPDPDDGIEVREWAGDDR